MVYTVCIFKAYYGIKVNSYQNNVFLWTSNNWADPLISMDTLQNKGFIPPEQEC